MRLDNVRLLCTSFDETFRFYKDFMGFKVTWGELGGDYASFDIGSGTTGLALFERKLMADVLPPDADTGFSLRMSLVFEASDLDATVERARQAGVPVLSAPTERPDWGIRTLHLQDPEGNLLEVFTAMPREQWSDELRTEAEGQSHRNKG
jgi:catechol 2,3-dioxygenase-like lactoylglutathione lyase family enzyme